MRVTLYWPECTLYHKGSPAEVFWDAPARTVFWVEATIQEVETSIRPHMTSGLEEYERIRDLPLEVSYNFV